jgi:hypothetical protein
MSQSQNRNDAIKNGLKTYKGSPCIKCKSTEKWVTSYSCVSCTRKRVKERDPQISKLYQQKNKEKANLKSKRWRNKDTNKKIRYLNGNLKKYGLTLIEYNNLVAEQQNKCYICLKVPKKRLIVDHCHRTGKTRNLLCGNCNIALGFLYEDIDIMNNMIKYIEKHSA